MVFLAVSPSGDPLVRTPNGRVMLVMAFFDLRKPPRSEMECPKSARGRTFELRPLMKVNRMPLAANGLAIVR